VAFLLVEHYVAKNPIISLSLFKNKTFVVSLVGNVVGAFGRGNVTYAMIFFFQGPCAEDPLTAGINLIPLGLGIIVTGLFAGALADKIGYQSMCLVGPVVSSLGAIGLALVHYTDNYWLVAFSLFVVGVGNGIFNSPNSTSGILSIGPHQRGVGAAVRLSLTFLAQMVGIVMTFALILNSIPYSQLLTLFIYGGGGLTQQSIDSFMHAIDIVFWVTFASFIFPGILYLFFPVQRNIVPPSSASASQNLAKGAPSTAAAPSNGTAPPTDGAATAKADTQAAAPPVADKQ